jgi:hypothetical protein
MNGTQSGLVSIVTPCLNGAAFLDETIRSVLSQSYRNIEYLLVDGGSTDGSVEIAKRYGNRLHVLPAPGSTQAGAINIGLRASGGEFFAFLNADDTLEPNAIERMVRALQENPQAPFAYADAHFIDERGSNLGQYPTRAYSHENLPKSCFICQPSTLMRSAALADVGGMDERYDGCFDYDLWIRLAQAHPAPVRLHDALARARMHRSSKTFLGTRENVEEVCALLSTHYGYVPYAWIHAYAGVRSGDRDLFFDPPRGSKARTLMTLTIGLQKNRHQAMRYLKEFWQESARLRHEKSLARRA